MTQRCTIKKMDLQRLMQRAQQMQRRIAKNEEELDATIYEGATGGSEGVSVKVSGKNEIQEITLSDELMDKENKEMLQDMLPIACNEALEKAKAERDDYLRRKEAD